MGRGACRCLTAIVGILLATISSAQAIRINLQQVWSGLSADKVGPYYVQIENSGPNEEGYITLPDDSGQSKVDYPVEIPSGSKKRVLISLGGYTNNRIELRLRGSSRTVTLKGSYSEESTRFGLIGDNPSDLQFLKLTTNAPSNEQSNAIGVGGCLPDDAPDRLSGYLTLDALVLGEGTERLRDEQVAAIKQYISVGGVVLFVGGASQSASTDPRWKSLLPLTGLNVTTVAGLTQRIGSALPRSMAVRLDKGEGVVRSYGLGLISYLSVNPFESPVREMEDRRSLVSKLLFRTHVREVRDAIYSIIGENPDYGNVSYAVPVASSPTSTSTVRVVPPRAASAVASPPEDPFQIKPPSVQSILWILVAYTFIVVPVNFFILRRKNRLELAWVSVPIISIIFSAVLLNSTIGLYSAQATTRTRSIALLGNEPGESLAYGKSEMFFPRAKAYDLGFTGVEHLIDAQNIYYRDHASGINAIDTGREILAPEVRTSNLAFRNVSYIQNTKELSGLEVHLKKQSGRLTLEIENRTSLKMSQLRIYSPSGIELPKDEIAPGGNYHLDVTKLVTSTPVAKKEQQMPVWQGLASSFPSKLVVFSSLSQLKVGPKYGAGHPGTMSSLVLVPQLEVAE